ALDRGDLLRSEVGRGAAPVYLGRGQVGEPEAEQGVGGGHDRAQALRGDVRVAERVLQGGKQLRRREVVRDRRVDRLDVRERGLVAVFDEGEGGLGGLLHGKLRQGGTGS